MAYINVIVSNSSSLSNGEPALFHGKNGFVTKLGSIPLLVNSYQITDGGSNVTLSVPSLNLVFDDNFYKHALLVNDGSFLGLKGNDYITVKMEDKTSTVTEGFVAFSPTFTEYSANILSYDLNTNQIVIRNETAGSLFLSDKLASAPFYSRISQILDPRYTVNNQVFIEGSFLTKEKTLDITGLPDVVHDIGITPSQKEFIRLYLDEIEQSTSMFTWSGSNQISVGNLGNSYRSLRTVTSYYTVPAFELGDPCFITTGNTFIVSQSSYQTTSSKYNAALTANSIYKVYTDRSLTANLNSFYGKNIGTDTQGRIGNVRAGNNSITFDYNPTTYPYTFNLANSKIYRLSTFPDFTKLTDIQRTITNIPEGTTIVRARNVNNFDRKSAYATQSADIDVLKISAVSYIDLSESLYRDTSQGISVRVVVTFPHILNQEVTDYEISWRFIDNVAELTTYSTTKVPATAVGDDGLINFVINNVERGLTLNQNHSITVLVTPLNKSTRGVTKEASRFIQGKLTPPNDLVRFTGGQIYNKITFAWDVLRDAQGQVVDIDLQEITIKRYPGSLDSANATAKWGEATKISIIPTPSTSIELPIDSYGLYTYLAKTKDTSGFESSNASSFTLSTARPSDLKAFKIYSEDDPAGNVIAGYPNTNRTENNYPSFTESDNGGFSHFASAPISSITENANGTSTGFSAQASPTDLSAYSNATYITQVRDMGSNLSGAISFTANGYQLSSLTWADFKTNLYSGVSEVAPAAFILYDTAGLGILSTANVVATNAIGTLYDATSPFGNLYAVWNYGQFAGDTSNAGTWATTAARQNANAVVLGKGHWANGVAFGPTGLYLTNVTQKVASYAIVNLLQWGDSDLPVTTWSGPENQITSNVEIRYSTTNVYYANGNVNPSAFTQDWITYNSSDITFQWFQLRFNVYNISPGTVSYYLDKLNYTVDLRDKVYATLVSIDTRYKIVDYASFDFKQVNVVNLQLVTTDPLRINNTFAIVNSSNLTAANISAYSNTGVALTSGISFYFTAIGT